MSTTETFASAAASVQLGRKPLRVWPGVVAVTFQWFVGFVLPIIAPETKLYAMLGGLLGGGLLVFVWWLFFSRARWLERLGAIVLMVGGVFVTLRLVDPSISDGMMGFMVPVFSIPVFCLALVCWAVLTRAFVTLPHWPSLVAAVALACLSFTLVRTGGMNGDGDPDLHWRWTPSSEDRLLANADAEPALATSAELAASKTNVLWPGFRGPGRDNVAHGVRIATDWTQSPPVQLWRNPVGPGWSSFAVQGDYFYTQEQRGPNEEVACYRVATGQPLWRHKDAARFWESNAGAGPRATPTLHNGRVYTLGATGIVNALNATSGALLWTHDAGKDTEAKLPHWGFAGSPLVVDDLVVVAAGGKLAAYEASTGKLRWLGLKDAGGGYSSPQLATIDGVRQIVLLSGLGVTSVSTSGKELWRHEWKTDGIVQPGFTEGNDVLIGSGSGLGGANIGVRRVSITHEPSGWKTQERWTSIGLKPQFNDFVVHKGFAYGFDGNFLACIDLADGKRKWKGGRYGHGQVIVLADQDLLLVLSEKGELALATATPNEFKEFAHIPSIEGKTWNHPVVAGDVVLTRNDQEMAAFRLPHAAH